MAESTPAWTFTKSIPRTINLGRISSKPIRSRPSSSGRLETLKRTYGYTPVAFTTSLPQTPLTNGIPFCKLKGSSVDGVWCVCPFQSLCTACRETGAAGLHAGYVRGHADREKWGFVQIGMKHAMSGVPSNEMQQVLPYARSNATLERNVP
jgi:hypothetical protein